MDWLLDLIDDHPFLFFGSLFVLILVLVSVTSYYDEQNWHQYSLQHHCEVKGTRAGQTAIGPSGGQDGGVAIVQEPDQTIYVCDGGEIVIR